MKLDVLVSLKAVSTNKVLPRGKTRELDIRFLFYKERHYIWSDLEGLKAKMINSPQVQGIIFSGLCL